MINKVNLNASVQVPDINKLSDEKHQSVDHSSAVTSADKVEISKSASLKSLSNVVLVPDTQRFMEVFTVNFWERGFSEAFQLALEALQVTDSDDVDDYVALANEFLAKENIKANLGGKDSESKKTNNAEETANTIDITVDSEILHNTNT